MNVSPRTLDVRPILQAGGEPLEQIMQATAALDEGQALRLLSPFNPVPLYAVMERRGFTHQEKQIDGGAWEIILTPGVPAAGAAAAAPAAGDTTAWPAPSRSVDLRTLPPPEPLVLTFEALEELEVGQVLAARYDREPLLLYPELDERGHPYRVDKRSASDYHVQIRRAARPKDPV